MSLYNRNQLILYFVRHLPGIGINVEKAVDKQFEHVVYDQYSMHVTPYCVTSLLSLDRNQQMYQIRSNKYYPDDYS